MDFSSQIVPALVIIAANVFSGDTESNRWECVTAVFGWSGVVTLVSYLATTLFLPPTNSMRIYLGQVAVFSLTTAISRDYEKRLKPLFPWNR